MSTFKQSSLGYLSGLLVLGVASALIGCGGGDDASQQPAAAAPGDETGQAGTMSAGTGGASASGSGGSSAAPKGGTSATGGSSAGDNGTGGSGAKTGTGGSGAKTGTGGSSTGSSSAGSSGTGIGPDAPSEHGKDDYQATKLFNVADPSHPQPLMQAELTLSPRDEVSLLAPSKAGGFGATLDDATNGYKDLDLSPMSSLADLSIAATASGNVDDDGNSELCVAGFKGAELVVRVEDSRTDQAPQARRVDHLFEAASEFTVSNVVDNVASPITTASIRLADVDQDGRDEILVAATLKDGRGLVRVYDDALAGYAELGTLYSGKAQHVAATFGNFDADPAPEVAIVVDTGMNVDTKGNVVIEVHDDGGTQYGLLKQLVGDQTGLISGANLTTQNLRIETGNFDTDGADELVAFAEGYEDGEGGNGPHLQMSALDDAKAGFAKIPGGTATFGTVFQGTSRPTWTTVVADTRVQLPDAHAAAGGQLKAKRDEIFVLQASLAKNTSGYDVTLYHSTLDPTSWSSGDLALSHSDSFPSGLALTRAAGRTDNFASDVIAAVRVGSTVTPFRVSSAFQGGSPGKYGIGQSPLPAFAVASEDAPVFLTGGDFDADAMRVRFTGNKPHQELMNPKPIVVVSAPPTKAGIDQGYADCMTAYEEASTNSNDDTQEYSITDTLTFSTTISPPIIGDFFGLTAQYTLSQSFTSTSTKTRAVTKSKGFTTKYTSDRVIFDATLVEVYDYQILGAASSDAINEIVTVNEPIATDTYSWTVSDYNSALAGKASPIDETIITHTIGDPGSYPAKPDPLSKDGNNQLYWISDSSTVPRGTDGTAPVHITVSESQTNGASTTTSSSAGGGSTGLVGIQYTQGWDTTGSYSWTVGNDQTYSAIVGGIAGSDSEYTYSFGLFVHGATLADGEQIQVIDYYTEFPEDSVYERH